MPTSLKYIVVVYTLSIVACTHASELRVPVAQDKGRLSEHLVGIHFVYNDEDDAIYEDDTVAKWARKAGVGTGRFPGGNTIKYWDWRNPTGYQKEDPWDPEAPPPVDPDDWMSLDEYLHFVDVSGIKPLIGINIVSGHLFGRERESIERAVKQVEYVVSKGYPGAFYYLGNEDFGQAYFGSIEKSAKAFVAHAREIETVDPTAKLFWNDNHVNPNRLKRFLKIAGKYADGVEFHGKWPYGGNRLEYSVDIEFWQKQYPIRTDPHGRFSERADRLRAKAAALGYPNLMVANNEYGLSQFYNDRFIGFDRYTYSLVVIELLQDLFIGRFDTSAFWSNVAASKKGGADREKKRLIDTKNRNRMNPMHLGFEMLAVAQGKRLLEVEGGSAAAYGFAAKDENAMHVFLLNKTDSPNPVSLELVGNNRVASVSSAKSLIDTKDHWGTLVDASATVQGNRLQVELPPLSYSRISVALTH